jgi:hypothetical protein
VTFSSTRSQFAPWQFRILSWSAFFMIAISWSPLLPSLLSLNSSHAFLAAFIVFSGTVIGVRGLNLRIAIFCVVVFAGSLTLLILTQSMTLWNRTAPLGFLVFVGYQVATIRKLPESICELLSIWLLIGILLSIVGFLYAFNSGEPLLTIVNPDGRDNSLYLTTMSGAQIGNIIRPAWVYDEPGAFSFIICATVALRHLLQMNARLSMILMIGGLITLSLTHLAITLIFLIARFGLFSALAIVASTALFVQTLSPEIDDFRLVFDRLSIEDGRLAGDNRSDQLDNFSNIASLRIFVFGDIECHDRPSRSCDEHGDISSSPVTPLYYGGLYFLITQLVVHLALIGAFFRRRVYRLSAVILFLLLLQRPYFAGFGYGLITYLILFLMFKRERPKVIRTAKPINNLPALTQP